MSMELIDKRKLIEKVKTFHKWCIHTDNFPMIPSKRDNVGYLADDVLFGIELEPTVKAIPLDRVEQIRKEITSAYCKVENDYDRGRNYGLYMAEQFIDKALKEQNE